MEKVDVRADNKTFYVKCSRCGKPVSNPLPIEVFVKAFIECSECVEKEKLENSLRSTYPGGSNSK